VSEIIDRFQAVFNQLNAENLDLAEEIYTQQIHFLDPIHEVHGIDELKKYFAGLYEGVVSCQFDFGKPMIDGNEASLPWVMHMEHGSFRKGETAHVPGISHLRFSGKIEYHRDYFDVGALIYERVPVLGGVIRKIKARL